MSSKLVKGGGLSGEQLMVWRTVGTALPVAPAGFPWPSGETPAAVGTSHGSVVELQQRIAALQREMEHKIQAAFEKGLSQGAAAARQQMEASQQQLARSVEEITGMRQRCRAEAEGDVVKLSLAVARRILHREFSVDPDAVLGLVKAAFQKMDVRELHIIRMHPEHAAVLRQNLEKMGLPQRCEVVADPALERGAAILETAHGNVDASTETQLAEIERGFADLIRHTK